MTEPSSDNLLASAPAEPGIRRQHLRVSLVWLVPLVAALVGASLLVRAWMSAGPHIRITFNTASGLEEGKTPVKYKDVVIGTVTAIALSKDHSHVVVGADLHKEAKDFARAGSRFWVVRPRVGVGGVSGIDTVLSGAYIGVDVGTQADEQLEFKGLETPPTVVSGTPGKTFVLHAADLGSLEIGSPVYYRRILAGEVASYELAADGQSVRIQVFVRSPYERFVTADTRFWNASGVDLVMGADGVRLNTQSLATLLAGGIAFGPDLARMDGETQASAGNLTEFALHPNVETAMAPPDGAPLAIRMRFDQVPRGLVAGAPVEFLGMPVGRVVAVDLDYDPKTERFPLIVDAHVYPERFNTALSKLPYDENDPLSIGHQLGRMVANGLRAQARTGNLLTGQLYVALEFLPKTEPVAFDPAVRPLEVPTQEGRFDKLQEQLGNIVARVEKIPFERIGQRLDGSLAQLELSLRQVNGAVLPQATRTLEGAERTLDGAGRTLSSAEAALATDAPLQQNLLQTLRELQRTARSVRELTDLLGQRPDALLRGRPDDPSLVSPQERKAP